LRSLVDGLSRFIVTTRIAGEDSNEAQANLLTKTCQDANPQNLCKHADEGEISNMIDTQNLCKLPLNPELTVFAEKPEESASSGTGMRIIIGDL
jgi:adenylylsulfate kinase-like enzyme